MTNRKNPATHSVAIALQLIALTMLGGCTQSAEPTEANDTTVSLRAILDNNLAAVRHSQQIGGVFSTEKILSISEADYTLSARYRATSASMMRIDVFADNTRVYSEGKDNEGVWEWPGGKESPENVHHEGVGALEHGIEFNLFALAELQSRGHAIEYVEQESIRGNQYYVLKVTLSDGFENYRYVNASTWLVDLSRDHRALHPAIDPTKKTIETRYDQWTTTNGVTHPGRSRDFDMTTGELVQTGLILQSRYNLRDDELDLARHYIPPDD